MICLEQFNLIGVLKLACRYRSEKPLKSPYELEYSGGEIFCSGYLHRHMRYLRNFHPLFLAELKYWVVSDFLVSVASLKIWIRIKFKCIMPSFFCLFVGSYLIHI